MTKIIDPDDLRVGTELSVNTSTKKIGLAVAGNLSTDGVSLNCLVSKIKELWAASGSTYIDDDFPFEFVSPKINADLINGWDFLDNTTRYLIRDGGWTLRDGSGVAQELWACPISLGAIGSSDQVYFQQVSGGSTANFQLTGAVNQPVKVYGDSSHGNFDYRSYFKMFVREQGKTYAQASLVDLAVTSLESQPYSFPLSNGVDSKIVASDATIASSAPYTGMSITYYATNQARTIGGTSYNFRIIVNGNGGTAEQVYSFVQYKLRQNSDIDSGAGTVIGKTADSLMSFPGSGTQLLTTTGVFIDNYNTADINRLTFVDQTGTERNFPFTAALSITFNANLQADSVARYYVYFASSYGTGSPIVVNDASGNPMSGLVSGNQSITHTFSYDTNIQGGRTAGTDANIVVVAIGLDTAQWVKATGTITRSVSNSVALIANLERSYANPV